MEGHRYSNGTVTRLEAFPPDVRFLLRAVHRGAAVEDVAAMLRLDEPALTARLRRTATHAGVCVPPPSTDLPALIAAMSGPLGQSLVDAAAVAPVSDPPTRCPLDRAVRDLALGRIERPEQDPIVQHAADCRHCLIRVLEAPGRPELDRLLVPARGKPVRHGVPRAVELTVIVLALLIVVCALAPLFR